MSFTLILTLCHRNYVIHHSNWFYHSAELFIHLSAAYNFYLHTLAQQKQTDNIRKTYEKKPEWQERSLLSTIQYQSVKWT